jgi:hypothetical protein
MMSLCSEYHIAADNCPKYICNSTGAQQDGICFNNNGTDFFGAKCPTGQRCPNILSGMPSKCKSKEFDGVLKLPGEKAYNGSDCLSEKMEKSYCVGYSEGTMCSSHSECDVGLICIIGGSMNEKVCMPAKKNGEACDHYSNICAGGLYCDSKDRVCEYYGSTKVGMQVGTEDQDTECESFFLDINDKVTCVFPPKRVSSEFVGNGEQCKFSYTSAANITTNYSEDSACGMTSTGKAWCDPDYYALDKQRDDFISYLVNKNQTTPCHIFSPFPFCERARVELKGFMDAIHAYYELKIHGFDELYKTILDVGECFHDTNPQYYYGGSANIGTLCMVILLYIILL